MSHEIESMFYKGETPWHGLGTKVTGTLTAEEAIKAAGLDWAVTRKPLAIMEECPCSFCDAINEEGESNCNSGAMAGPEGCRHTCHTSPKYQLGEKVEAFATIRSSDNKRLGLVGPEWTPLQNVEAFKWFDPFVADGIAEYHTAGSLRGGALIWVLAEIKAEGSNNAEELEVVPGDRVRRYILLSNSHDGTQSVRCGYTTIRVVCANTLAAAHGDNASKLLRIRHTENVKKRLDAVRELMHVQHQTFVATVEQYKKLAACHDINQEDLARYVRIVFFGADKMNDESVGARIVNGIFELFYKGKCQQIKGVKGTMWAAYNAVTEYLNYERGRSREATLGNVWFGDSVKINETALTSAVEIADEKLGEKPPRKAESKVLPPKGSKE